MLEILWGYFEFCKMEIVNQRQKMLDTTESNAKGNDNFATKVISAENEQKKCGRSKKKESNLFFSKLLRQ